MLQGKTQRHGPPSRYPLRIVVISDTHLALRATAHLENCGSCTAGEKRHRPDLVVHLGDISVDGASNPLDLELRKAATAFADLSVPITTLVDDLVARGLDGPSSRARPSAGRFDAQCEGPAAAHAPGQRWEAGSSGPRDKRDRRSRERLRSLDRWLGALAAAAAKLSASSVEAQSVAPGAWTSRRDRPDTPFVATAADPDGWPIAPAAGVTSAPCSWHSTSPSPTSRRRSRGCRPGGPTRRA